MKERMKTAILWLVIGAGVIVIFADTWRRIDLHYSSEGLITETMMCIIMGGIPSIAFAGVVYIGFNFLFGLFTKPTAPVAAPQKERPATPQPNDFED